MSKRNGDYFKPQGCGMACDVTQDNQNTMLHLLSLPFPKDKWNSLRIRLSVYIHPCSPSFSPSRARWFSVSFINTGTLRGRSRGRAFPSVSGHPKVPPLCRELLGSWAGFLRIRLGPPAFSTPVCNQGAALTYRRAPACTLGQGPAGHQQVVHSHDSHFTSTEVLRVGRMSCTLFAAAISPGKEHLLLSAVSVSLLSPFGR